jgi:hypothetical protein
MTIHAAILLATPLICQIDIYTYQLVDISPNIMLADVY